MTSFKWIWIQVYRLFSFLWLSLFSLTAYASYIENTIGTAVVNDATASYFNPAALVLMKNTQIIPQLTVANFDTRFSGNSASALTHVGAEGNTHSNSTYYSPSLYLATRASDYIMIGLAVVSNTANRNIDDNSILRYVQANNNVEDLDIVPAIGFKINSFFSLGAGVNFSYANFELKPITGFPGSNVADSQSNNKSDGYGVGGNMGFVVKLNPSTVIGFNYRTRTTYNISGQSNFEGPPNVVSNNYYFQLITPSRNVFSINHFFTNQFGIITTIQRIEWSEIRNIHIHGIASARNNTPVIANSVVPFYLRDTWLVTLGSQYRFSPDWILRLASSYNESPANPHYQVATGNSIVLGLSTGYAINKTLTIDGSYAHAFMQNESIHVSGPRFLISGINKGYRDSVTLKLTLNI